MREDDSPAADFAQELDDTRVSDGGRARRHQALFPLSTRAKGVLAKRMRQTRQLPFNLGTVSVTVINSRVHNRRLAQKLRVLV
ncbi:unnamed protein product [Amoebophrya sp. A120]|nr:unnamed protein product [Amoebophrya sp. A120]|eukprot:GSA120T00007006001.1